MKKSRVRLKERVRLPIRETIWEPIWGNPLAGWARNYIKQNIWRLEPGLYEIDDLMQEAYLVFAKVVDCYPRVVEPAHFMALYQTVFRNLFWDLTRKNRDKNQADENGISILLGLDVQTELPTELLLAEAPVELRLMLSVFEDEDLLNQLREPQRKHTQEPRRNLNQRLCDLIGLDPDEANLVSVAKAWLQTH